MMECTFQDLSEKNVFIEAKDREEQKLLGEKLYDGHIPFDSFYNPKNNLMTYLVSSETHKYLVSENIQLQIIGVKDIGDLSPEERREVKRYHRSLIEDRRKEVLERLRRKYRSN